MTQPISITEQPPLAAEVTGGQLNTRTNTTPILFTAYGGYQLVDSGHFYRLRFNLPVNNVTLIRSVKISFTLLAATYVSQTTTAGATSGAGSAHLHNITTASNTVVVDSTGSQGGGIEATVNQATTGAVTRAISHGNMGAVKAPAEDGNNWLTFNESAHTHSIPTVNLNAPSALGTSGQATGAQLTLVNVTAGTTLPNITPPAAQAQPPYNAATTTDFDNLDFTSSFGKAGIYELQISSTAIGGIIAAVQVLGDLTVA